MRFNKGFYTLLLLVLIVLPAAVQASTGTVGAGIVSGTGVTGTAPTPTTSTTGINFDPSKNVIGGGTTKVSTTTVNALTFLSGSADPVTATINLINTALGFLGLLSMLLIVYAGVLWFLAGDNEENVTKAKDILKGAVIGLLLTLSAFGIAQLVFNQLVTATALTS